MGMRARALLAGTLIAAAIGCERFAIDPAASASMCADGVKDGDETDVDCGGAACGRCAPGRACAAGSDCEGGACLAGVCAVASCLDGIRDGTETDVDCGGGLCPLCGDGLGCASPEHCASGVCAAGACAAAACTDGVKNGLETGVDCGGGCPGCAFGEACAAAADCEGGACRAGRCAPIPRGVWEQKSPAASPPARRDAMLVWNPAAKVTLVYGGADPVTTLTLGDAFTYDGTTWTPAAAPAPGARQGAAISYESSTDGILLFGGLSAVPLADTWEWNGAGWVPRTPPSSPSVSAFGGLAYDGVRARGVLLAGMPSFDGTWEWDGYTWAHAALPAQGPPARVGFRLAFDRPRGETILFGGAVALNAAVALGDTWRWNGAVWAQAMPPASPPARFAHALAADPDRGVLVLAGGVPAFGGAAFGDTWEWDGATWARTVDDAKGPKTGPGDVMAYDAARRRMVLVAHEAGQAAAKTWEYHALAVPCAGDGACGSGHCVDGLCCATACGVCQACNLGASAGACAAVKGVADPDSCSGVKTCDAAGACVPK
jgi:hypothetical protein